MTAKGKSGLDKNDKLKGIASFFAGASLAFGIVIVVFAILNEGVGITPNPGEIVVLFAGIGLTIGFKISKGMKQDIYTFLLPVGFFSSLLVAIVILSYSQLGQSVWLAAGSFGSFFLFSTLLIYSEQINERKTLKQAIDFISNRLSWGLLGYFILSTFLKPALQLLFFQWREGTLNITIASTTLLLGLVIIGMFAITLGIFNENASIRKWISNMMNRRKQNEKHGEANS